MTFAGKGAAVAAASSLPSYTVMTCRFPSLSLFFFSLRVGVVRQPDERYICKSFAEKVKRTPAVGSGELRKRCAGGIETWSRRSLPFLGSCSLGSIVESWLLSCVWLPPSSFFLMTV